MCWPTKLKLGGEMIKTNGCGKLESLARQVFGCRNAARDESPSVPRRRQTLLSAARPVCLDRALPDASRRC